MSSSLHTFANVVIAAAKNFGVVSEVFETMYSSQRGKELIDNALVHWESVSFVLVVFCFVVFW